MAVPGTVILLLHVDFNVGMEPRAYLKTFDTNNCSFNCLMMFLADLLILLEIIHLTKSTYKKPILSVERLCSVGPYS